MARHAPPVRLRAAGPAVEGVSTSAPVPVPTGWPNNGWAFTGSYSISNSARYDTSTDEVEWMGERDVLITQTLGYYASNVQSQIPRWIKLKNQNPNLKLLPYCSPSEIRKVDDGAVSGATWLYELVNGPNGNSEWYLVDSDGNKVQSSFSSKNHRTNWCEQFTPNNSSGRSFSEEYWKQIFDASDITYPAGRYLDWTDGMYADVVPPAAQRVFIDNSDPRVEDDMDFNRDGTADFRAGETQTGNPNTEGGALMYRDGASRWVGTFQSQFPAGFALFRNSTRDGLDYSGGPLSGSTIPQDQSDFYKKWHGGIYENATSSIGFRKNTSTNAYDIAFGGGLSWFFRYLERIRLSTVDGINHPWYDGTNEKYIRGACQIVECQFLNNFDTADWNAVRFFGGICALAGVALGNVVNKAEGMPPLDEYIYDWGDTRNPYLGNDGDRHKMGVLDPSVAVNGSNADYSGNRSPDFTNGSGQFHWAEFDNCLWVTRTDQTGITGGVHGDGSSVSCTLPSAGSGFHWERFDVTSTYTNPNSGWQTRAQDTTLNSGGTVASVSLLPWHSQMVIRVAD